MRLLLDTHTLLWFLANDARLSQTARAAIEEPAKERWLSPVSMSLLESRNVDMRERLFLRFTV
jgi:PIN domain nuclease of toxin-antitoxin system